MFGLSSQTFEFNDIYTVALLLGLEILLSADNAIILAVLVRHLKPEEQKKALFYGLAGAFVFRFFAILCAVVISGLWWFQAIGALYLVFICLKHFASHSGGEKKPKAKQAGFWATVFYVELTDVAFAVDSVLVAIAVEKRSDKFWVVFVGAMMGVFALRWAAGVFLKLLKKFPILDHMAFILVGWAGLKLLLLSGHTFEAFYKDHNPGKSLPVHIPVMEPPVFWGGVIAIVIAAVLIARMQGAAVPEIPEGDPEEMREELEGTFTPIEPDEPVVVEAKMIGEESTATKEKLGDIPEVEDEMLDGPDSVTSKPDDQP